MKKFSKQFDELFSNMIAAGEAGGVLDTILSDRSTPLITGDLTGGHLSR
ncbi:MAG TPA: hypothetical protein QF571_06260 [Desulfobacterales bacterium]|nr:hypothetical protein [Desulfobacterales bacterium]